MAGTTIGGQKAAAKNLSNNPNFYKEIGSIGGKNGTGMKGFALNKDLAREAGRIGGRNSKPYTKNPRPSIIVDKQTSQTQTNIT